MWTFRNRIEALALGALLICAPALAQPILGPACRQLAHDVAPLSTDCYVVQKLGATRSVYQLQSDLLVGVVPITRNVNTTAPLTGGGPLSADLTLAVNSCTTGALGVIQLAGDLAGTATAPVIGTAKVTYAKIQNVTNGKLLGRSTAGAGVMEELNVGSGLTLAGGSLSTSSSGTVTSVAETVPSWLAIAGSPVTTSGTLAITAAGSQTSHQVIGTCNASTSFGPCSLVAGDLPVVPLATGVSGTLAAAQFPALTGDITTSAGSLATTLKTTPTITTPVLKNPTIGVAGASASSHIICAGTAPTVSCTGLGSTGTAAVNANGNDCNSAITMSPSGTGIAGTGTCTLTFNGSYVTNVPGCFTQLVSGTGSWSSSALNPQITTESLTAPQITWNNTIGLTTGLTYKIRVLCFG